MAAPASPWMFRPAHHFPPHHPPPFGPGGDVDDEDYDRDGFDGPLPWRSTPPPPFGRPPPPPHFGLYRWMHGGGRMTGPPWGHPHPPRHHGAPPPVEWGPPPPPPPHPHYPRPHHPLGPRGHHHHHHGGPPPHHHHHHHPHPHCVPGCHHHRGFPSPCGGPPYEWPGHRHWCDGDDDEIHGPPAPFQEPQDDGTEPAGAPHPNANEPSTSADVRLPKEESDSPAVMEADLPVAPDAGSAPNPPTSAMEHLTLADEPPVVTGATFAMAEADPANGSGPGTARAPSRPRETSASAPAMAHYHHHHRGPPFACGRSGGPGRGARGRGRGGGYSSHTWHGLPDHHPHHHHHPEGPCPRGGSHPPPSPFDGDDPRGGQAHPGGPPPGPMPHGPPDPTEFGNRRDPPPGHSFGFGRPFMGAPTGARCGGRGDTGGRGRGDIGGRGRGGFPHCGRSPCGGRGGHHHHHPPSPHGFHPCHRHQPYPPPPNLKPYGPPPGRGFPPPHWGPHGRPHPPPPFTDGPQQQEEFQPQVAPPFAAAPFPHDPPQEESQPHSAPPFDAAPTADIDPPCDCFEDPSVPQSTGRSADDPIEPPEQADEGEAGTEPAVEPSSPPNCIDAGGDIVLPPPSDSREGSDQPNASLDSESSSPSPTPP